MVIKRVIPSYQVRFCEKSDISDTGRNPNTGMLKVLPWPKRNRPVKHAVVLTTLI